MTPLVFSRYQQLHQNLQLQQNACQHRPRKHVEPAKPWSEQKGLGAALANPAEEGLISMALLVYGSENRPAHGVAMQVSCSI